MKHIRWYILTTLILALLAGSAYITWRLLERSGHPPESPLTAIPGNTSAILRINRPIHLWNTLHTRNLIWKHISGYPGMSTLNQELIRLDSMARKNLDISGIIEQNSLYIAVTLSGRSTFGLLYLTSVAGKDPARQILKFIRNYSDQKAIIISTPYAGTELYRVQISKQAGPFFFSVFKGVVVASIHADLVKKSIDRLSLNAPGLLSSGFRQVEATTGKKADANLFINFRFLSMFLYKHSRSEYVPALLRFSRFADWMGADLILKDDEVLMGGFTVASDTSLHYLSLLDDQKPQKITATNHIPSSASWFVCLGLENPAYFLQQFHGRITSEDPMYAGRSALDEMNRKYRTSLIQHFLPWMGNQAAAFSMKPAPEESGYKTFALFRASDPRMAIRYLDTLSRKTGNRPDSIKFGNYRIYGIYLRGVIPAVFGHLFHQAGETYAAIVHDFILTAPDLTSMKSVLDMISDRQTLAEDAVYKNFSEEFSAPSNILFFYNPQTGNPLLRNLLSDEFRNSLRPAWDSLIKFEGLSFRFITREEFFYTSGFLRYNPRLQPRGPLQWETILDTTITGGPQIVQTGKSGKNGILVTDTANNLYFVDAEGTIRWKIHFMGRLLSRFIPLNIRNEDSTHFLFNTDSHLYLIRSDGIAAPRFPMRFPIPATSRVTLADFGIPFNYFIFVALNDRRIYQFNLEGNSVLTWNRPVMEYPVTGPVDQVHFRNRDYICIRSEGGEAEIVKRSGNPAFRFRPPFRKAPGTGFHINRSNKRGILLTTDEQGNVVYIRDDGRTSVTRLRPLNKNHYFFYEDITGSGSHEFIFIDRSSLFFYDRDLKMIYHFTFRREITTPPFLVKIPGKKPMVGVTIPATRELFLFDGKGSIRMEPGIRGTTMFDLGYLDHPRRVSLVVGDGKILRNYRLSQP